MIAFYDEGGIFLRVLAPGKHVPIKPCEGAFFIMDGDSWRVSGMVGTVAVIATRQLNTINYTGKRETPA